MRMMSATVPIPMYMTRSPGSGAVRASVLPCAGRAKLLSRALETSSQLSAHAACCDARAESRVP
jgi:hypothetical protein